MTQSGPFVSPVVGVGVKAISIYEYGSDDNFQAAMDTVTKRMLSYVGVVGYTCDIKPSYRPEEALKLME